MAGGAGLAALGTSGLRASGVGRAAAWDTVIDGSFASYSTLVVKATRITRDEGNSSADPHLPIRHHSGAVHARQQVLVDDRFPNWEVRGDFQAPSARGTWPAFWLTGVNSWPPESDIPEYEASSANRCGSSSTSRWRARPAPPARPPTPATGPATSTWAAPGPSSGCSPATTG